MTLGAGCARIETRALATVRGRVGGRSIVASLPLSLEPAELGAAARPIFSRSSRTTARVTSPSSAPSTNSIRRVCPAPAFHRSWASRTSRTPRTASSTRARSKPSGRGPLAGACSSSRRKVAIRVSSSPSAAGSSDGSPSNRPKSGTSGLWGTRRGSKGVPAPTPTSSASRSRSGRENSDHPESVHGAGSGGASVGGIASDPCVGSGGRTGGGAKPP